jgi:hypothetical protein
LITDLFVSRYPSQLWWSDRVPTEVHRLFVQSGQIVFDELGPAIGLDQPFCKGVHDALCRELGTFQLNEEAQPSHKIGRYLVQPYDHWNDSHGTVDAFIKTRLSTIELLFRLVEERVSPDASGSRSSWRRPIQTPSSTAQEAVRHAVEELNERLRQSGIGLRYHAGMLHPAQDELSEQTIIAPCWELLKDQQWSNAERELKEALDRSAQGQTDAAFHAGKALESVVKVISDTKCWTTGNERGAANYIDNLVSQRNGRFIDVWESELLKAYFTHVRNPQGHGAGTGTAPVYTQQQTTWAIESAMTWIKALITRL